MIVNVIINEDLYKLLILLFRIDNFDFDKDLRHKYSLLKGIKTTDFEIDPYLSLAEPHTVIKEASIKYGITIKSDVVQNPTVQKLDFEDVVNLEFKEYFRTHKAHIEELPGEVQVKLLQKARIRPY